MANSRWTYDYPARADLDGGTAAELLARGPVTPILLPARVTAWAVTHDNAVRQALASPTISKDPKHWHAWTAGQIPDDWPLISWVAVNNMFTADGDEHARLRGPVKRAFTPARVAALEPRITSLARAHLGELVAVARDEVVDLKEQYAVPLPLQVICELFAVPTSGRDRLRKLCDASFDQSRKAAATAARTFAELREAVADLAAAKRADPGDDLASALVTAPGRLSETEVVDTLVLLIGAGHETTVNLITNAVRALLLHPDQLALLTSGHVRWETAVEQVLQLHPPITAIPLRYTTADTVIGGTPIPAGEAVLLCYGAANRDPARHGPRATAFDLTRLPGGHLAFGHGPHLCLGAALARIEARIALTELFARFHLEAAVPDHALTAMPSVVANGPTKLPVRLSRR